MNARRIFEWLLWLYPKSFRQRYGVVMTDTFVDLHRHTQLTGLRFWSFVLTDTIRAASVQHLDLWASDERRVAVRWLLACTIGTVICNALGGALTWCFSYFYHPYLEGTTFLPSIYGALLGTSLGMIQSLMFPRFREQTMWIFISATSAAVGFEMVSWTVPLIGPVGYGIIVGTTVASAQWLALRGRMKLPSAAALISAFAVGSAALVGSVAVTRSLAGLNALGMPRGTAPITIEAALHDFYMPMDWRQCLVAIGSTAIAGLLLGAVTVRPASSLFARAH